MMKEIQFSDLTELQARRLVGKFFYFEPDLYSQVKDLILQYPNIIAMLDEVQDENIKAYLQKERREIENELLRQGFKTSYPDYPQVEDIEEEL